MSEELKACPFCGGDGDEETHTDPSGDVWSLYGCGKCSFWFEDEAAWNKRVEPKPIHYAHEAACELTKLADRFDHPGKYTCDWHKKVAAVLVALSHSTSTPSDEGLNGLSVAATQLLRERPRKGMTLIELLVVIAIFSILLVLGGVVFGVPQSMRLSSAAAMMDAQVKAARDRAALAARDDLRSQLGGRKVPGYAGLRLTANKIIPLGPGGTYSEGRCSIYSSYPAGFTPPPGRLVLEEAPYNANGIRNNPTSWWWNVRVGDKVNVYGHDYIVCGPMEVKGDDNPGGFVNMGQSVGGSPLDRGDGPVEFLLLSNGHDDDRDGIVDRGWNGIDDDLNGTIDDPGEWDAATGTWKSSGEWEQEQWLGLAAGGPVSTDYLIRRRPKPESNAAADLPSGIVADLEGSTFPGILHPGGYVDLVIDDRGSCSVFSIYAVPPIPYGSNSIKVRLAEYADEDKAITLVVDMMSGKFVVEEQE